MTPENSNEFEEKTACIDSSVYIPKDRYNYLKNNWKKIYEIVTEKLVIQIRYNVATKYVDLRTCELTPGLENLTVAQHYIEAIAKGFTVDDSTIIVRLPNVTFESVDIKDQKISLKGSHFNRAIGRVAGRSGSTLYTIENATKTRLVMHGRKVHILGLPENIKMAKSVIQKLIIGAPANQIYGSLKSMVGKCTSFL
ncbi:MAG: pre-rRNA-processing protein pno1 [Marteilia pararefringens]